MLTAEDLKVLYVVYRKGGMPKAKVGKPWLEFKADMTEILLRYYSAWFVYRHKTDEIPMGFAFIDAGGVATLKCQWFPWAGKVDRLRGFVHLVNELRKDILLMFWARPEEWPFFTHICKYGILKRVGRVESLFWDRQSERDSEQDDGMLFISLNRG